MLFGVGCTPDGGGDEGGAADGNPATITLSKTEAGVGLEGGSVQVDVTSNAAWVVSCDQSDVTFTPATGEKTGTVTITVPASTVRTVNVVFTATKKQVIAGITIDSTAKETLVINQNATGEVVEGGIASINEVGEYEIEGAWVLATYAQGFLMTDNSGGIILVYQGNGATVPAVGQVVNVSGTTVMFGGLLQFGKDTTTINPVAGQTVPVTYPSIPTVLDYAAIQNYVNNPSIFYAEMKGKLVVSRGSSYNNYNVILDGGDAVQGSVSYPTKELEAELLPLEGAQVIIRGYMIGKPNSNAKYAQMMTLEVELDASYAAIHVDPIKNVPAAGVTNATHNLTLYGVDAVTATPDGTVVTAASVSGDVLTYSVSANTGADRLGSITLSAAGIEPVVVTIAQLGAIVTPTSSMEFSQASVLDAIPDLPQNKYGSQNVADIATYLTVGDFLACKVCLPQPGVYYDANCLQMQGNTDVTKQGRVGNTVATPGKIKKIIVESYNEKYTPNFNLALGTEQVVGVAVPTGMIPASDMVTESEVVGDVTKYTSTYEVFGDYNYFAIYKNTTGAFYFAKITVEYAAE